MNINYNKILKELLPYLWVLLLAYIFTFILSFLLPINTIELNNINSIKIAYTNYANLFTKGNNIIVTKEAKKKKSYELISNIELKAVYLEDEYNGWVILEDKSNKTFILENEEIFRGYVLKKLYKSYVIFEKNSKTYQLKIKEESEKLSYIIKNEENEESIEVTSNLVKIKRNYLNNYISDFEKIWEDIQIKDVRKDGKIIGFKVFSIKEGSVFMKLGLEKGDIIKSVNNTKLKSYNEAFKIYKRINSLDFLQIEVLRDGQIVELSYEIN